MAWQNWRKIAFVLAIIGSLLVLILLMFGVVFYAGGNFFNPSAPGYSMWLNSWSDLGRTVAWSGEINFISQLFFSLACVFWIISFVPSIHALQSLFSESRLGKLLSNTGTLFALISAITVFLFVFFFSEDLHPFPHRFFAVLGYFSFLLAEILYAFVMFIDKNYPNTRAMGFLAVGIVLFLFLIFNAAILQKLVTFIHTIVILIVFYSAVKSFQQNE
ncbi:MAG: hypothetical protein HWN65_21650 [Candidatus Helarchaeota archaeon]|nr:hypothetical protein [Candidatus Helarchaeota archaeon]